MHTDPEAAWERRGGTPPADDEVRAWLAPRRVGRIRVLGGGLRNVTLRVELDDGPHVLRVHATPGRAAVEIGVHRLLAGRIPLAPLVDAAPDGSWTLWRWVGAGRMVDALPAHAEALGAQLGAIAARIHTVDFPEFGELGPELTVVKPMGPLREGWQAYIAAALFEGRAGERLGLDGVAGVWKTIEREGAILDGLTRACLCHGDLKPTNVRVDGDRIVAVVDWEFAWAGHPLFDLGQALRWADRTPGLAAGVARGYGAVWPLPSGWERAAALVDLVNLVTFLDGEDERPTVFRDVAERIRRTCG